MRASCGLRLSSFGFSAFRVYERVIAEFDPQIYEFAA
jgi:hypothetical protein